MGKGRCGSLHGFDAGVRRKLVEFEDSKKAVALTNCEVKRAIKKRVRSGGAGHKEDGVGSRRRCLRLKTCLLKQRRWARSSC